MKKFYVISAFTIMTIFSFFFYGENISRQPASTSSNASFLTKYYAGATDMTAHYQKRRIELGTINYKLTDQINQAKLAHSQLRPGSPAFTTSARNLNDLQFKSTLYSLRSNNNVSLLFMSQMMEFRMARAKSRWLANRALELKSELKAVKNRKTNNPDDVIAQSKKITELENRITKVEANKRVHLKNQIAHQKVLFNLIYSSYPTGSHDSLTALMPTYQPQIVQPKLVQLKLAPKTSARSPIKYLPATEAQTEQTLALPIDPAADVIIKSAK